MSRATSASAKTEGDTVGHTAEGPLQVPALLGSGLAQGTVRSVHPAGCRALRRGWFCPDQGSDQPKAASLWGSG